MCGISGILSAHPKKEVIEKMTARIAHRGPDAQGIYLDEHIALGHRRLPIIDLSEAANQPMTDVSGRYVIVFNGEIYNYKAVRAMLPDYPFQTQSDSETILAAYQKWGIDCLAQLNGMFAFALWDKAEQHLILVRDRLGVKPLYYAKIGQYFIFASEIRSILASNLVHKQLDNSALCSYLQYQSVFGAQSIVQGIKSLPAGHYGVHQKGRWYSNAYWQLGEAQDEEDKNDPAHVHKRIRGLLHDAVQRRMVSDVPVSAFLSGGIDSSAIVALMAEQSAQPINTFSITFEEPEYDESIYSDMIAKRFNTRHTQLNIKARDFLDHFKEALLAMDNPSGDGFNTYLVSKITQKKGIKVALSGIGGDELFAGYAGFKRWLWLQKHWLWKLPVPMRDLGASLMRFSQHAPYQRIANLLAIDKPNIDNIYPSLRQVFSFQQARSLLRDNTFVEVDFLQSACERWKHLPLLSQYSAAELSGYTQYVLLKDTDQMSMTHALEVREPFFDHELIEYVLQVPDALKYPKYPKSLLVESLSPLLPDDIVHRPKKGFSLPWPLWLKGELRNWCEGNIKKIAQRPEFNETEIQRVSRQFYQNSDNKGWMAVLELAVLEHWLAMNFDELG